jgi:hypothetical protein
MCNIAKHHKYLIKLVNSPPHSRIAIQYSSIDELKLIVEIIYNSPKYFEVDTIHKLRTAVNAQGPHFEEAKLRWTLQDYDKDVVRVVASVLFYINTEAFERVCVHNDSL